VRDFIFGTRVIRRTPQVREVLRPIDQRSAYRFLSTIKRSVELVHDKLHRSLRRFQAGRMQLARPGP
jgi:hypothetical protein